MKVHAASGDLLMTIYYWWNQKPELCHFPKLLISFGMGCIGMSDIANLSIVLNVHSKHIYLKLCLKSVIILLHMSYVLNYFSWLYQNVVVTNL